MIVKNILEATDDKCTCCDSWIAHWVNITHSAASKCSITNCKGTEGLVGAHVRKVGSSDSDSYIIPLCSNHNQSDKNFEIGSTKLIPITSTNLCHKIWTRL